MKVEIWSDILCPFCYIGKRKFEQALAQFPEKDAVEIEWKSFQLSPSLITDPSISSTNSLAKSKNIPVEEAQLMIDRVTSIAKNVNLNYDFERAVVANSYEAHRLLHLAKEKGIQNEVKEKLLRAYFVEGKNIADFDTLILLGEEVGLNVREVNLLFKSNKYADEVAKDIDQAQEIGVTGVPFFVFNRKYAVSGAQEAATFLNVLEKAKSNL
jgi:predicted DsbA family dithiol-disulfide isomerase